MSELKKISLATVVDTTGSTFAGEAGPYISAALLSASTIDDGGITVLPNVKYKQALQKVSVGSGLIAPGECDFNATSSVTLSDSSPSSVGLPGSVSSDRTDSIIRFLSCFFVIFTFLRELDYCMLQIIYVCDAHISVARNTTVWITVCRTIALLMKCQK